MIRGQNRRFSVACLAAAVVILVDQTTKSAALTGLSQEKRIPLLGDLLGLQLAFNPGAILSLGAEVTGLLTLLGAGVVAFLVFEATRADTRRGDRELDRPAVLPSWVWGRACHRLPRLRNPVYR